MLIIRKEHLGSFRAEALLDFEERMLEHLKRFSPRHFRVLTDDQVRAVIREGIARAACHRLTSERSIRYYVDVMFMVGSGFDADPLLPWAASILAEAAGEATRVDRLYVGAWAHVERVLDDYRGLDGATDQGRFIIELRQIRNDRDEPLSAEALLDFRERTSARLSRLFPRKHERAGEAAVGALLDRGVASAARHGITTERGAVVFIAMMFVLGAGFAEDPLLPWVSAILADVSITDPRARVDQLFSGAVTCLGQWWDKP